MRMGISKNPGPSFETLNSRFLIIETPRNRTPNVWKQPYVLERAATAV